MNKSPISCNHANEMPAICPCDDDCYCKEHSCKSEFVDKKISKADLKTKIEHLKVRDNSFLVVRVGSDNRPATDDDIQHIESVLKGVLGDKFPDLPVIITHHNLDVKLYTCK